MSKEQLLKFTWEQSLHLSLTIGVDSNPLKYWRQPG